MVVVTNHLKGSRLSPNSRALYDADSVNLEFKVAGDRRFRTETVYLASELQKRTHFGVLPRFSPRKESLPADAPASEITRVSGLRVARRPRAIARLRRSFCLPNGRDSVVLF